MEAREKPPLRFCNGLMQARHAGSGLRYAAGAASRKWRRRRQAI